MNNSPCPAFTGPDILALEAHAVVALLNKGEVGPKDLLDATFQRIEAVDPAINAMPTLCPERAYKAALALAARSTDARGWLGGLPLGIKDLDRVKGVRTTFGTKGMADHVPEISDHFVDQLESRGGLVVGKTNTPELGAGANTFNAIFGATRNPWDTRLNAAGSSGGAAASLATGQTWLSQGSDHGGSLRTPAAYCGVVGLRTVPGRVATTQIAGVSAGFVAEGVVGPMARSVTDVALFLDAMSGFEPAFPGSLKPPAEPFQSAVRDASSKVRIAYAPDLDGFGAVEPVIRTAMDQAMSQIEKDGGTVEATCPDLTGLEKTYRRLRGLGYLAGAARAPRSVSKHFKETLRRNIEEARRLTTEDFAAAQVDRTRLHLGMVRLLRDFDVLACASVGAMPRAVEIEWLDHVEHQTYHDYLGWMRFAFLATTTGLPAASVPIGFSSEGMPIGLQLIGPPQGEAQVLAVARAIERAVGGPFGPIDPVERA